MVLSTNLGSESPAGIDSTCLCQQVSENAADVPFVLESFRLTVADLERRLAEESEKRLALTAIVNSSRAEMSDLKKALDTEVKARCAQIERLPAQQSSDEAAPFQKRASDICYVSLSIKALKDAIDLEKRERMHADETLLKNISARLDREKNERRQADFVHLEELNAMFDEHLENHFKERNKEEEKHVNNSHLQRKGHVASCVGEKMKKLFNKGSEINASICKKTLSLKAEVLLALFALISIVQGRAWLPKSLRNQTPGGIC